MSQRNLKANNTLMLIAFVLITFTISVSIVSAAGGTHTITDMTGNTVTVPDDINKVVTFNAIPVLNSYIIALGKGDTIMNSLSSMANTPYTKYQTILAPQIESGVDLGKAAPNAEQVMAMNPDVVITSEKSTVDALNKTTIPVVFVPSTMGDNAQNEKVMTVLGKVFNQESKADEYNTFSDEVAANLKSKLGTISDDQKPKVLNMWAPTLAVFNSSGWVVPAGGKDAFDSSSIKGGYGGVTVRYQGNVEEVQKWNPDVIVVRDPTDIPYLKGNSQFSNINAVKNDKIYVCPAGLMTWVGGAEVPLMAEWIATKLHPDKVSESDLVKDTKELYKKFFAYDLTDAQAKNIINGTP
ncbi:ABC transporter substrate-binding protein [Methanospirillum lacunae]|uniref:Fe/B12 periplasmic-binding domain-containing protein n=1 Tax=Methanospirillum lacunae TaxID=668570 RepID=A0A2V2MTE2_9EURY|nr:ABC transporter substrate-binding protein [Methanospirillum lacunae]PWR71302.1 hypothetical protein DK846_10560 [Methanospirillum lacunae]